MDPRVTELHCIMPMTNIGSVMTSGVPSYENAATLAHSSIALQPVRNLVLLGWMSAKFSDSMLDAS